MRRGLVRKGGASIVSESHFKLTHYPNQGGFQLVSGGANSFGSTICGPLVNKGRR